MEFRESPRVLVTRPLPHPEFPAIGQTIIKNAQVDFKKSSLSSNHYLAILVLS